MYKKKLSVASDQETSLNGPTVAFDGYYPCGRTVSDVKGRRIVDGENVTPHSQPWMVTVSEYKYNPSSASKQGSYGCGGTLISRKHVLSAAHCAITCKKDSATCNDKRINWATLGDHDKRKSDGELFVPIIKPFYIHPKAKQNDKPKGAFAYDYVIFILECCVTFNNYIQPICFPTEHNNKLIGKKVLVCGWGHTTYEGYSSPILQSIEIEIIDNYKCANAYSRGSIPYKEEYLFCAGDVMDWDKDACQNDSGGKY